MKNYGLQVKEIPIIFRGTLDQATQGAIELYSAIDRNYSYSPEEGGQWAYIQDHNFFNYENLSINYNGTLYKNVPRYEYEYNGVRAAYFGQDPEAEEAQYPFWLECTQGSNQSMFFMSEKPAGDTISLTIWSGDPEISGSDGKRLFMCDLTGNGQINRFYARFACGENGTLHLKPYVILNGNIRVDLCNFAQGGDQYIAGDNETISFDCFVPVETHAVAYVEAENVGEYPSVIDAAMVVQYEDFIEAESIVGYEGINLRRR